MNGKYRQSGFGVIAAMLIVVLLGSLAAVVMRTSSGQQAAAEQDMASALANQAARAGVEWGLYQALMRSTCNTQQTLDFTAENGFTVVVRCTATQFSEGLGEDNLPVVKRIFAIDALACNAAPCPNAAAVTNSNYVERRRMATACATQAVAPNPGKTC